MGAFLLALAMIGCGRVWYDPLPLDASVDASEDATADRDAGLDAEAATDRGDGLLDDGDAIDAGPPPGVVTPIFPWNGFATGSPLVPIAAPVVDHPLRPKLKWLPVSDATSYEVEVDDSCGDAFRTCAFPSPELAMSTAGTTLRVPALPVSMTPPVGRRYVWRVRACNEAACSAFSEPRYLDVGRHGNDFDGDGYADLLVGSYAYDNPESSEGNAFVYYGGPGGYGAVPDLVVDNPTDQAGANLGWSVASAGDLDGDGFADVVIGAHRQSNPESSEGNAFVFYGGAAGIGAAPDVVLDNPGDEADALFGYVVASAGDVDADGYADVIVGAPLESNPALREGNAYVFRGGSAGVAAVPDIVIDSPVDQADSQFGVAVASAGDLDGDGYVDLVIGALEHDAPEVGEGNAFVYYGGATGVGGMPDVVLDNPADATGGHFGVAVASAGDLDADGFADLAIGASEQASPESREGNAFVYYGGASGIAATPDVILDNPLDQMSGGFGRSVAAAGDVDGDGDGELLVGAYFLSAPESFEGGVFIYEGGDSGIAVVPDLAVDNPLDDASGWFGWSVVGARDIDVDGYADMVVGARGQSTPEAAEGNVYVYRGSATGVIVVPATTLDNPTDQVGADFGESVASAPSSDQRRPARRTAASTWRSSASICSLSSVLSSASPISVERSNTR